VFLLPAVAFLGANDRPDAGRPGGRSLSLVTERVWNAPWPDITVVYRNTTNVHFRVVPYGLEERLRGDEHPDVVDPKRDTKALLGRKPVKAWSVDVPYPFDGQERWVQLRAPSGLKPGPYFLLAGCDPAFDAEAGTVACSAIWVSNLALITRIAAGDGELEGFVLNAITGEPIADAPVRAWLRNPRTHTLEPITFVQTDEDGLFRFEALGDGARVLVYARYGEQAILSAREYDVTQLDRSGRTAERTVLLTDRSRYRPGQTVHYKGIGLRADRDTGAGETLREREVTVVLGRVNGAEVSRQRQCINDYGSFSGTFDLPQDIGVGPVKLSVEGGADGETTLTVGDDEPPPFEVTPEPANSATARLNEGVVVRADVTDATGVVRSATGVLRAAPVGMRAEVKVDDWQTADTPVAITAYTRALDGAGVPWQGRVKVFRLQPPAAASDSASVVPSGDRPARVGPMSDAMPSLRPGRLPSGTDAWGLGDVAFEAPFRTDSNGVARLAAGLGTGAYRAVLTARDHSGIEVSASNAITVVDPKSARFPVRVASHLVCSTTAVEPGGTVQILWGTGYERGRAFIEIEHRGRAVRRFWTGRDCTQVLIEQPVTEALCDGLVVRATLVRENVACVSERRIDVPWSGKRFDVVWARRDSVVEPGSTQTWAVAVRGTNGMPAVAEVVAVLTRGDCSGIGPRLWPWGFGCSGVDSVPRRVSFENAWTSGQRLGDARANEPGELGRLQQTLPSGLAAVGGGCEGGVTAGGAADRAEAFFAGEVGTRDVRASPPGDSADSGCLTSSVPAGVAARLIPGETALFLPQLRTDSNGTVQLRFTTPVTPGAWHFMAFAHDTELRAGLLEGYVFTTRVAQVVSPPLPPPPSPALPVSPRRSWWRFWRR